MDQHNENHKNGVDNTLKLTMSSYCVNRKIRQSVERYSKNFNRETDWKYGYQISFGGHALIYVWD